MRQQVKLHKIKGNPSNPRIIKNDKFKKLVKSIQDFPEMLKLRPIVVDEDMIVLGGNMRLKASKDAGLTEVWIEVAEGFTEEQKKEFIVKDNVGFGEWEWDILANEWDSVQLADWGLDVWQNEDDVKEGLIEDDEIPEVKESIVKRGDIWQLGEHRVMCGDSTSSDDVAKLMNGYKAELLFTSPPYSDMRDYNGSKDLSVDNLIEFIPTFLPYAEYQVVNLGIQRKDNEIVQYWDDYINKAKECGYKFLSWNIWSRRGMGGSIANMSAMFRMEHEWIFVFGKKRKDLNDSQKNQSAGLHTGITNRQKDGSTKKSKPKIVKEFGRLSSIIEMSYGNSKEHPAVFPIEFPSEYIKAMTNTNNIIVDCFLGSGTTLIAAEKLNRKCYGMELDEKYCDVIINRWEQFTGLKAIKNGTK
jgi:DNA modification methylase